MLRYFREPVSGLTHLAGAILVAVGLNWLIQFTDPDPVQRITILIYGITTMAMFLSSAALHLYNGSERVSFWLRRIDHAAIYFVIAGTYTPILVEALSEPWRLALLATIWTMALIGVVYKLLFLQGRSHLSTLSYLAMGWLAVVAAPLWFPVVPDLSLRLILAGGVVYTAGALIFMLEKPNFHPQFGYHELWHLFVLGGCGLHFLAVVVLFGG